MSVASTTIRISQKARDEARELARATGKPISQAVEAAIRAEHRRLFWASFRQAAAIVSKNPVAATGEATDRELFEGTLADGLDAEPIPD
ncbi:MAG: ribbon-helix-helix protein, CopG family [Chloroflexi bacterium]|nr:MAG: ribbon-helix-helix protein, CopG family [Chloroflexota bacterium]